MFDENLIFILWKSLFFILFTVCQNVDGHTTKVLAEFEKQYISQNGESPDLTECMKNLREAYKSSIETYKQNVTSYSKKYFTIPPNVLLPGNEDQRIQLTDLEHQKLDEDIKVLEQKIQNVSSFTVYKYTHT